MRQNGVRSNVRFPYAKKANGGSATKKGYTDRKDESIAMRIKKPRTAAQLTASRDESLGMRRGKESTKTQSFKSRRDESRGASK